MTTIAHLFDRSAGWAQRVAVKQLLERLPSDRFRQVLAVTDPAARVALGGLDRPIEAFSWFSSIAALAGPSLARFTADRGIDIVFAWGVRAALAAGSLAEVPLVVHLADPAEAARHVKRLRAVARPRSFAVACGSELVRRRLVEGGLPFERTVVVRPGVDFALLNRFRRGGLRERLGLSPEHRVVLLPECHDGGINAFEACQAVALKQAVDREFRLLAPGAGTDHDRTVRFARTVPPPCPLVTGDGVGFEELVTAADVLLATPRGDADVTAIAWAMGAGVGVIGTAVHCVAELIASRVNGLLFKQTPGRSMATSIARLLDDRAALDKARETARGQAYEVFGVRRYVEQTMRLCENLLAGGVPAEGITDPAMTG